MPKTISSFLIYSLAVVICFAAYPGVVATNLPRPTPSQLAWQEAELIVVFHYDLHVFDNERYIQRENRITPIPDYNIFNPADLDTDQWIGAAADMGAKCAILTATHETGFALYQSDVNPYCLKAVRWRDGRGDVVGDFVKSCRKYGIEPGIYIGIRWNSFYGVHDFKVTGDGDFAARRQAHYNRMVEGMVTELCTRYGPLFEIWFDGGAHGPAQGGPDVRPIIEKYQPDCIFYHNLERADHRWGGSESGTVPYPCWSTFPYPSWMQYRDQEHDFALIKHGDPDGAYWCPAMSDAPLRGYNGGHEWFWEPGDDEHIYPLAELTAMYEQSVGRNSTLILGITPGPDGLVPEPDVRRMRELGDEIKRRYGEPLASTSGEGCDILLDLGKPLKINCVIIMEDIAHGERVREYAIEGYTEGAWRVLGAGTCIGHKRIQRFDDVVVSRVRLRIDKAAEEPVIRRLSVYSVI